MRTLIALAALLMTLAPASADRRPAQTITSLQAGTDWINAYRATRDLDHAPYVIRSLSRLGAFREPEAAGVYVGFIAGLIGSNPDEADRLIDGMLGMRAEDQWALVRGIAYSGSPHWKNLLRAHASQMPARRVLINGYLSDKLPVLDDLTIKPSPTTWQRIREAFAIGKADAKPAKATLTPSQTSIDTLWGYYLASGEYAPVMRIVDLLPWASDRDDAEKLTTGSMARYTLAMNASRDPVLLDMLKVIRQTKGKAKYDSDAVVKPLDEVIEAAELADASALRKDALASIEQLKIKGPAYKRELSNWGKFGQGALAVGCVVAAATGHVELGLPCVIGGGATNAAAYYMNDK